MKSATPIICTHLLELDFLTDPPMLHNIRPFDAFALRE